MCWHYIHLVLLYIQVICFEYMAAWKRCDMQNVCGNIFEDCKRRNVQHKFYVQHIFSQILQLFSDTFIGIC